MEYRLEYIDPNPWQPRLSEDGEHIKELALSIARDGLMQIPVGRLVDQDGQACGVDETTAKVWHGETSAEVVWDRVFNVLGCRIQLAFGHSRLAAFRWLEEVKANSNLVGDWSRMPVLVRDLDDETMARMAIEENVQRRDLNAVEEGMAMLRLRNEFGMTAGQIGEIFGLADSSVRNKMRLLELPVEALDALKRGTMAEGVARELLRYYELGEAVRRRATVTKVGTSWDTESAADAAMRGSLRAEDLRLVINRAVEREGHNLHEAPWKWSQAFDLSLDYHLVAEVCQGCKRQMEVERKTFCVEPECYFAKRRLWIKARLAEASFLSGIRAVEEIEHTGIQVEAEVRGSGCANLRVVYRKPQREDERAALVAGFEDCMVVCGNRNGICTCANGLAAKMAMEARLRQAREVVASVKLVQPAPAEIEEKREFAEVTAARAPTSEDLREAAREGKRQKAEEIQELEGLREEFARRVRDAVLGEHNRFAMYFLINGSYNVKYQSRKVVSIEETVFEAALKRAAEDTAYWSNVNLPARLEELNVLLKAMGLKPIEPPADPDEPVYVPVEVDETPAAPIFEGKPLMEVFAEEGERNENGDVVVR